MKHQKAFTLVELLVVIGIIALLMSLLLPALTRSRQHAASTVCKSNMHQISLEMQIYANNYKGWIFPVGDYNTVQYPNQYETLGTNKTPTNRWPMRMGFTFTHPNQTLAPYNTWDGPNQNIPAGIADPQYDAAPWTPPILRCPSDLDALEGHSYILNKHLAVSPEQLVKAQSRVDGTQSGNIIILGEKVSSERDYYMEVRYVNNGGNLTPDTSEFAQKVELYRHGRRLGSNYLFKDWHVDWVPPEEALNAIDPWGLPDNRPN